MEQKVMNDEIKINKNNTETPTKIYGSCQMILRKKIIADFN